MIRRLGLALSYAGVTALVVLVGSGLAGNRALAIAPVVTHGPVIGDVTTDHVQIWGRTNTGATVEVAYGLAGQPLSLVTSIPTSADKDFTFIIPVTGLDPDTAYDYTIKLDNEVPSGVRTFRTSKPNGDATEFKAAFVSDSFPTTASTVFEALRFWSADGLFVIGDYDHSNPAGNAATEAIYLDKLRTMHRRLRGQETPIGRDFATNVVGGGIPMLGRMLDDHDSGNNDLNSRFKWWTANFKAFQEYFTIPSDNGFASGGMWQAFQRGRALFIMMDLRSQRDPVGSKTILGNVQKTWLTQKLIQCKDSTITWCVLVSTVPFNPNNTKTDSWHGYPADTQWLLDQIAVNQVPNVLVVSGDCHYGSIVRKPLSPLDELNIPKSNDGFANTCSNHASEWTLNSTAAGSGFGLLTLREHEAVMEIYNADKSLRLSSLVPAEGGGGGGDPDSDGDGVPDSTDQCPAVPGVPPSGCPLAQTQTQTFTRTKDGEQFQISLPPYTCRRLTGGASVVRIIKTVNGVEQILKAGSVPNPAKGVQFTMTCEVTGTAEKLYLDGVLKLTAAP